MCINNNNAKLWHPVSFSFFNILPIYDGIGNFRVSEKITYLVPILKGLRHCRVQCNINASKVLYHNFLIYLTSAIAIKIDVKMELVFSLPRNTYTYSVKVRKLKVEFMTGGTWWWGGQ